MEMTPPKVLKLLEEADLLRRPDLLQPFCQACEADYRGRKGLEDRPYPQAAHLQQALQAALAVQARDLEIEGLSGPQIGEKLRRARVQAIAGVSDPGN